MYLMHSGNFKAWERSFKDSVKDNTKTHGHGSVPIKFCLQKQMACYRPFLFINPWSTGFLREAQHFLYAISFTFYYVKASKKHCREENIILFKTNTMLTPRKLAFSHKRHSSEETAPGPSHFSSGRNQLSFSSPMSHFLILLILKGSLNHIG